MTKVYTIRIGFNKDPEKAEEYLLKIVEKYRSNNWVIAAEASNLETDIDKYELDQSASDYSTDSDSSAINLHFDNIESSWLIIQAVELNSNKAIVKEALCRAFLRLVIKDMHLKKLEVNLTVS